MRETDTLQDRVETLDRQINELKDAESLAETPFGRLFHAARTSRDIYTSVAVAVSWDGTDMEVNKTVVKCRQGEHYRNDGADFILSLPVKPFMDTRTARQELVRKLRTRKQNLTQNMEAN